MSPEKSGKAKTSSKVIEIGRLAEHLATLRANGNTVVQCHGVFDLLHIGHVRHIEEAGKLGNVLVVTITEDRHVNKGPHRPAFSEALRAEGIAALEVVDFVAINRAPTAVEAIELLKPDVYVKGPDYQDPKKDVTGAIGPEEQAVLAVGGRVHFTDDITFSSSHLINRFVATHPPEVQEYLAEFRSRYSQADVVAAIESLRSLRVVLIGETILDEYIFTDQMGKSAKEPVLAMRYKAKELFPGGVLAVANHLASFCASVDLISYLGSSDSYEEFVRGSLKPNVRLAPIYKADSPTIVKRRYVENYQLSKLFEVYFINDELLTESEDILLGSVLKERLNDCDLVLAADFGHGLMTDATISALASCDKFLAVNTQINAANIGFHAISNYPRADYICIHEGEVRLDARSRRGDLSNIVQDLAKRLFCPKVLVTRGKQGVAYFEHGIRSDAPAFMTNVVDRIGAGDAVLALTSLCVARGMPADMVAFLANVAGAQKLQILGNRSSIEHSATLKFIESLLK